MFLFHFLDTSIASPNASIVSPVCPPTLPSGDTPDDRCCHLLASSTPHTKRLACRPAQPFHPPPKGLRLPTTTGEPDPPATKAVNGKKRKAETAVNTTKVTKRTRKTTVQAETDADVDVSVNKPAEAAEAAKPKKRARKANVEEETVENEVVIQEGEEGTTVKTKQKRSRKKKDEIIPPLADRTAGSKLRVGAHSQRTWKNPELNPEHATLFIDGCKNHSIDASECCVPHGSYLVNLAHPDEERKKQAYDSFHDDLTRCHKAGIKYYNFHPGNAGATTREGGIELIAEAINKAHEDPATGAVVPLLETMATLGNTIGGQFKDIAEIIELVEDKHRIGVCLDTCHVFAAGYDLRTPEAYERTMKEFDETIGLKYLKALHVNDSKAPLYSFRDLHARIGTGYLGLRAFHNLVNDERLHGLPMVLETPIDKKDENGKKFEDKSVWAREIKMLEQLVGMDVESDEFKKWEADLHEEGASERERVGEQVKKREEKNAKPKKKRGKKKAESEDEDEDDDEE
ncbi:DNA-(apurinic or apyrimidinic site) lyase [Didymosphaeria variabile]|uniref:Apurinic-apyrimidinic endonuclease 1 n=1 Tax=Didymosphaeria variabile TaxID=1932322 RepID=A0A9W8XDH5_9PLEO|nr:DNA-(apurinic or apyrimidinic site) lyase [Didymosphaeria variabile]KAJ4347202.1 DNA-(apurinic or apyrimidinic site) lyase [Didymosphaeria variabile]